MNKLKIIRNKIIQAKDVIVSGHKSPDGDSIGSLLALGLGLKILGKRVYMLCYDDLPKRYINLPGVKQIKKETHCPVDLAIAVDCSNKEILGKTWESFKKAKEILEIDHHQFRRPFGTIGLIDNGASAVGELIYLLLKELKIEINRPIAQNLLTSIIVESNSFRLPNVRPFTFKVCAELVKTGMDFYKLVDMVFWSRTKESIILSGLCLNRVRFLKNNRLAWSWIKQKDFDRVGGRDYDVDSVVDELRSIQGVQIAVLFREAQKESLRVSLRSKGRINVARIAEGYNGGGHFDVAGCNIPNTIRSIKKLLNEAEELL